MVINHKIVKDYLKLSEKDFNMIRLNKAVMEELIISVKDSVKPSAINRRVKLFTDNKYNQKQLLITLKMERHMKGSNSTFELDHNSDKKNSLSFDSIEDYLEYHKKLDSTLMGKIRENDTLQKKN